MTKSRSRSRGRSKCRSRNYRGGAGSYSDAQSYMLSTVGGSDVQYNNVFRQGGMNHTQSNAIINQNTGQHAGTKKNKKGGWLEPTEKEKCVNKLDSSLFIVKGKTYGKGEKISNIQSENLSMFPDSTCFKTAAISAYINDLLAIGIGPDDKDFVTPINNTPINAEYLDKLGIEYKKENLVPKSVKEAFNIVEPDMDYRTPEVKENEQKL